MSDLAIMERLVPAVREAGNAIMEIYAQPVEADEKADGSPVTEADRAAEAILLAALVVVAPDIPVVSEENSGSHTLAPTAAYFLVDPLDGTREFLRRDGQGAFTVNIGLIREGVPVAGVVFAPALDRMFVGAAGEGAHEYCGALGTALSIRACPADGAVAVASRSHRDAETDAWLAAHEIRETVSTGSSLKFCLIAAGEADVYPRFGPTMEWDTAAGDAVLRAAGGRVECTEGKLFRYGKPAYRNTAFIARGNA